MHWLVSKRFQCAIFLAQ
uniref:Uncharacterized protein n=1 Tax=Arundo donax TaxID=35708 RepID=A0A0A9HCS6_ARUDO